MVLALFFQKYSEKRSASHLKTRIAQNTSQHISNNCGYKLYSIRKIPRISSDSTKYQLGNRNSYNGQTNEKIMYKTFPIRGCQNYDNKDDKPKSFPRISYRFPAMFACLSIFNIIKSLWPKFQIKNIDGPFLLLYT